MDSPRKALTTKRMGHHSPRLAGGDLATTPLPDAAAGLSATRWPPRIPGYELLEVIGRGGMGVVYKARQTGLNRLVALKLISAGAQADGDDLARFVREAEAVGALRHPNIVPVYEVGEHDGRPYLSLEYVDGGTLADRIQDTAQSPAFAAEICETVARAAHAVHAIHVVHRDLKPANILLQTPPDGGSMPVAKIADFGLAKRLDADHLTETGMMAGTPAYMAPEQVRGERDRIGPAADVWSIGVILYEMLTGRPPFLADCPAQTMADVLIAAPETLRRRARGVPRDLETICLKCLEKKPDRRYPTALALADDLRRFREGRPVVARRVRAAEQAWRWCRRNPAVAGLLAGLLVVFATGAAAASLYAVRADRNARLATEHRANAEASERDARAKEFEADAARREEAKQKEIAAALARQAADREARGGRERYALDANLALTAWQSGDVTRTRQFLDRYAPKVGGPDLRGFEWHYLDRLSRPERQVIPLGDRPWGLTLFGSDGLAFGRGKDFCVHVPDRLARSTAFPGHANMVYALATNPRTGDVASGGHDGTVRVWNPDTGKTKLTLNASVPEVFGLAYTPDGRTLVACGGRHQGGMQPGATAAWDADSGELKYTLHEHTSSVDGVAISGDGRQFVTCGIDGRVNHHDLATGRRLHQWTVPGRLVSVALHPKDQWIAVGSMNGPISVLSPKTGAVQRELHGHTNWVSSLACSPDESVLASGGHDGGVRVWDPTTGEMLKHFRGHTGLVTAVAFRPHSAHLVSVGLDGFARVWDVRKNPEYTDLGTGHTNIVTLYLTADGAELVGVSRATMRYVFDLRTDPPTVRDHPKFHPELSNPTAVLLPDGDTVALVPFWPGRISFHSHRGGQVPPPLANGLTGSTFAAAPNGRRLAVVRERWVDVVDLAAAGTPQTVGLPAAGTAAAYAPGDEPLLAVAHRAGRVTLFRPDGTTAGEIATDGPVTRLAFSPTGTTLAAVDNRSRIRLWDVTTGREEWCSEAHTQEVYSLVFSPAGDRLLTASEDGTAKLLDAVTGRETIALRGHGRGVRQALFARDGSAVFTLGSDSRVFRWETRPR